VKEEFLSARRNTLQQLLELGQSPWIDDISRGMLTSGGLAALIEQGITGLTSNPAIFRKAMAGSPAYDADLYRLSREGRDVDEIHDALVREDIGAAADLLLPVYERTNGRDGLVSVEVPPQVAHDVDGTMDQSRRLWTALSRPNIMIKIPATPAGMTAIQQATAEGINVTVTLVFSHDTYRAAAHAYLAGLEERVRAGLEVERIASVSAMYISRVDVTVDEKIDELMAVSGESRAAHLRVLKGKAAIANAKMAYASYQEIFSGPRWEALARLGARTQRCLWASTQTKNPAYRDVRYVEELIGPETANTMPPATIAAFLDHGRAERTLGAHLEQARQVLEDLDAVEISLSEIGQDLQRETLQRFCDAYDELIESLDARRAEMPAQVRSDMANRPGPGAV
jgi:transaldolase